MYTVNTHLLKKISILTVLFVCLIFFSTKAQVRGYTSFPVQAERTALSEAFRFYKSFTVPDSFSVPRVVEIPLTQQEFQQQPFLLVESATHKSVFTQISSLTQEPPAFIERNDISNATDAAHLLRLVDSDPTTFFDFASDGVMKTTRLTYTTNRTIISSQLSISLSDHAPAPERVSIFSRNDRTSTYRLILSEVPFDALLTFPESEGMEWMIVLAHKQPVRIAEIKIVPKYTSLEQVQSLRFLGKPGVRYTLYLDPVKTIVDPYPPEYIDLMGIQQEVKVLAVPASLPNPAYRPADTDMDGIVDGSDNCINVSNADQLDKDANGRGDACEDFDRDGVMNHVDNCPEEPNNNQANADGDEYGDFCDPEESRITERIWWLPWAGIGVGFVTVLGVFAATLPRKKTMKTTGGESLPSGKK